MRSNVQPFLPSRPSGIVFIGLNILRILSIIALILVFSSNIVTMVKDVKAIKAPASTGSDDWDCEYLEYSTVPDQVGGPFWSVLNRIFITLECIVLVLSEIGVPRKNFEEFMPVLGSAHGLGCLGVFQALIATQMLSHYCELFPQISSWLLFIIGCFNIIAGLVFRQKGKEKRLIFSWENVSSLTPQTRMAATAWDMVHPPSKSSPSSKSKEADSFQEIPLYRPASNKTESPLLPPGVSQNLGKRFSGLKESWGFGRQAEQKAGEKGYKISRPLETLPR